MLKDYRLPPLNGGKPDRAVIFLHGFGDSGSGGLLGIGQAWQSTLPTCEFICPDAPEPVDGAPADFPGRQWFNLQPLTREVIEAGITKAAPILDAYIDHVLVTHGLTANRLALVGFSQGAMMALYVAPRRKEPVACVIGYSGEMTGAATLAAEKKSTPPILLVHGTADEVVPYAALHNAKSVLASVHIPVTTLTCTGLGHSIDESGVRQGLQFLLEKFAGIPI